MKNRLKYWGKLENGEAVFAGEDGEAAIEKDHRHLVTPTPQEKQEIFRTWPGLIDMHLEQERLSRASNFSPLISSLSAPTNVLSIPRENLFCSRCISISPGHVRKISCFSPAVGVTIHL